MPAVLIAVTGLGCIVAGIAWLCPPLGLITLGVVLLLALGRDNLRTAWTHGIIAASDEET